MMTLDNIREAVNAFNRSRSFDVFMIELDLLDIDLDEFQKAYANKVASKWPYFLDKFVIKDTGAFDLKKFTSQKTSANEGRMKLPFKIFKAKVSSINQNDGMKTVLLFNKNGSIYSSSFIAFPDAEKYGIDFEAEMYESVMYEASMFV